MKRTPPKKREARPSKLPPAPAVEARPTDFSSETRAALALRSGGRCEVQMPGCCGKRPGAKLQAHHRKRRRHGDHSLANAIHACMNCHTALPMAIHADIVVAYKNGWLVREQLDPAATPWTRRGAPFTPEVDNGTEPAGAWEP